MEKIEQLIIKNLVENVTYSKIVSPFLNKEYFDDPVSILIIGQLSKHVESYKTIPSYEQLAIDITNDTTIDTAMVDQSLVELKQLSEVKNIDKDNEWLIDTTEKHFQMSAIKKATFEAMEVFTSKDKRNKMTELPDIMRNALKLSFKNTIGDSWGTEQSILEQYDYYHSLDNRYPVGNLESFNKIFRGGLQKKRLYILVGGVGVGKTLMLINFATQLASTGCNILYVSLEISENEIKERIDANQLQMESSLLPTLEKSKYISMVSKAKLAQKGQIIQKEYPTCGASAANVRTLIDEIELKQGIKIDFLVVDYLNICASSRFKDLGNSYTHVKSICEEFRGLAVEKNIGVISATQSNRAATGISDFGLDSISESHGTAMTSDWVGAIIFPEDLRNKNMYLVKQLKSRLLPITAQNEKFLISVDRDKQMLIDLGNQAQDGLIPEDSSTDQQPTFGKKNFKKFKEEDGYESLEWNM